MLEPRTQLMQVPTLREVDLDNRYAPPGEPVLLSGVQALVRLVLEQRRLDASRGLATGAFVSGYPGSPLGGLDRELVRAGSHLAAAGAVFEPAVNEELAATAVAGTQLVPQLPGRTVDGVTGFWFGKAPGLDRAADAIRHGNTSGTSNLGGVVAFVGDDPTCKSSTIPSSCELMAESLAMPLLAPGHVEDVVRLGLHAVAISRDAGLWTALKLVSDVADATAAGVIEDPAAAIPDRLAVSRGDAPTLLGASAVAAEHDLFGARLDRAREYGRAHRLNRVVHEPPAARLAIVAPGPTFAAVERALDRLGIDAAAADAHGLRLVRLDLVWPIHPDDIRMFAAGAGELLVVEDKRAFVERQVRDALYGADHAPVIVGKRDAAGAPLVPLAGAIDAGAIVRVLSALLPDIEAPEPAVPAPLPMARTPFFCSGCPHNLSTRAEPDRLVGAGIGCHALVALDPAGDRGRLVGAPQMGGEGAQWIGMAPFTGDGHYVQNLGDGTFHHSGSLAIRAAVAAGVNLTFRLLYNDAIAMTGGQRAPGRLDVVDLVRWLELEGVRRVIVTGEDPDAPARAALPACAEFRHRDELAAALEELAAERGVTVLLHTDRCATEERRLRKRGRLPSPAQRAWINERVCEGCGDCGRKSSCLSVVPTETEFGRKTQVHQSSCTQDLACLEGDCPSFLLVEAPDGVAKPPLEAPPVDLPEPVAQVDATADTVIRMPGIGGTGVVTVSQVLQAAALMDGRRAAALDQTGLAQKGGAVVSDVRIGGRVAAGEVRAARAEVDVLLGFDLLGAAAPATLRTLDPARTIAVVNGDLVPTAATVTDPGAPAVPVDGLVERVAGATRTDRLVRVDANRLVEALFADHMPANMLLLGAAYQHGCLPVSGAALERAIALNGAAVDVNLAAFRWGRAVVVDRAAVEGHVRALAGAAAPLRVPSVLRARIEAAEFGAALRAIVEHRAAELVR